MIILVGASASGKTEVAKLLRRKYGIKKVVTHTTRSMREGEVNHTDYHFVAREEFNKLRKDEYFVETTHYNGNLYGTSKPEIADDKVLIVDPNGLKAFKKLNDPRIVTFYMDASETTRMNRMLYRGDTLEHAKIRLENDRQDFSSARLCATDFIIDTEKFDIEQVADLVYKHYSQKLDALKG